MTSSSEGTQLVEKWTVESWEVLPSGNGFWRYETHDLNEEEALKRLWRLREKNPDRQWRLSKTTIVFVEEVLNT